MIAKKIKIFRISVFFLLGVVLGTFVLLVSLVSFFFWSKYEYRNRVYPGVFLSSVALAGKKEAELETFLEEKESVLARKKVTFLWEDNGRQTFEITPQGVFSLDRPGTVKRVMSLGRGKNNFESLIGFYRLFFLPGNVEPSFSLNEEKLGEILSFLAPRIEQPMKEALFEFKGGKVATFQVSQTGKELDKEHIRNLLIFNFSQLNDEKNVLELDLPIKEIKPKLTTQESNNLGIKEKLGEGESFFFDSIASRVYNIGLAASRLHGVVVAPGEIFSFSGKLGEVSAQTGYQQAYVIREKQTILEDGGGVCQVSTTLFRAALAAGLPIVERQPHYYRVGFYEQGGYPPGMDATVYPPSPDLKFKNDTQAYLLIQANFDKTKKRLAFTLYGTSDGRKTEVGKVIFHSRTPPPEPTYLDDPTLPTGTVKQTDQAHPGAKVSFARKVWFSSGELKEERTFWSDYTAWPAVFLRGTGL